MQRLHHHDAADHCHSGEDCPRLCRRALLHVHLRSALLPRAEAGHQRHRRRRRPCTGSFEPSPDTSLRHNSATQLHCYTAQLRRSSAANPDDAGGTWPGYSSISAAAQQRRRIRRGRSLALFLRGSGFLGVTRS